MHLRPADLGGATGVRTNNQVGTEPGIYRSVGPGNTSALASGTSNALQITGASAGFAVALPLNVGVGDAIVYSSNTQIAFISERISATSYVIQAADGSVPGATNNDTTWAIYRAYTSLTGAFTGQGNENTGIPAAVRGFELFSGGANLVTLGQNWHIACYGDAPDTLGAAFISNGLWTTDAAHYLRIFVPNRLAEVGTTQRHAGVFDASRYYMRKTSGAFNNNLLFLGISALRIEGLQFYDQAATVDTWISLNWPTVGADIRVSNTVFRGNPAATQDALLVDGTLDANVRIWNTIFQDFPNGNSVYDNAIVGGIPGHVYAFNNTSVNVGTGFSANQRSWTAINNIVVVTAPTGACVDGMLLTAQTDYTVCSGTNAATATGAHSVTSTTPAFVNAAGGDFHLAGGDSAARAKGLNLSTNANLSFSDAADGTSRVVPWNIGAL